MQNDQTRELPREPVNRTISLTPTPLTALTTDDLRTVVWTVADSAGPTTDDASVQMTLDALGLGHVRERPVDEGPWEVQVAFGGKGKLYAYEIRGNRKPQIEDTVSVEGGSQTATVMALGRGDYVGKLRPGRIVG